MRCGRDHKLIQNAPGQVPSGTFGIPHGLCGRLRKASPGKGTLLGRTHQSLDTQAARLGVMVTPLPLPPPAPTNMGSRGLRGLFFPAPLHPDRLCSRHVQPLFDQLLIPRPYRTVYCSPNQCGNSRNEMGPSGHACSTNMLHEVV